MKETTKYNNYRFVGDIKVDEIQPWFDFDKGKPWDEEEVPWVLENKVRREILISLAEKGPQSADEIYSNLNFSPKALLVNPDEHIPSIKYQWTKDTIENHLLNLEWYKLIKKRNEKYEITIPILTTEKIRNIEQHATLIAKNWLKIIRETKNEVMDNLGDLLKVDTPLYEILIEKVVEKLYILLKNEGLLSDIPNIKALWAEQLRKIKFEEWVAQNF